MAWVNERSVHNLDHPCFASEGPDLSTRMELLDLQPGEHNTAYGKRGRMSSDNIQVLDAPQELLSASIRHKYPTFKTPLAPQSGSWPIEQVNFSAHRHPPALVVLSSRPHLAPVESAGAGRE